MRPRSDRYLNPACFERKRFEMVREQDVKGKADGDSDRPGERVKTAALFKNQPDRSDACAQKDAGLEGVRHDVDELFRQSRPAQDQGEEPEFEFESDQGVHAGNAFRECLQPQQQERDGRGDPPGDDGVAEVRVPQIEKAVEDDDGDCDFKGHPEIFRKYRDNAETDGAHDKSLCVVGYLKPVMDEGKPNLKGPEGNEGLFFAVFSLYDRS